MKRSNYLLFFLLIAAAIWVYAIEDVTIEIHSLTNFSNTTNMSIPVNLNNNGTVIGLQVDINHTNYLIFKGISATPRIPNATIEALDNNSLLKIALLSNPGISPGNGSILNILFDINASAASGNYSINLTNFLPVDIATQHFSANPVQSIFTILVDSDNDKIDDNSDLCPSVFGCLNFSGCSFGLKEWLPPIINQTEFNLEEGATLPLKFSATNCSGAFYTDNNITVRIVNNTLGINKTYNASGQGNGYVNINATEQQYHTNIHTSQLNMPLGDYDIFAIFSNNLSKKIGFELVQQGPTNGKGKGKQ